MEGYKYCNAAELLKHTWDGWPRKDQARFETMLREIFYPIIKDFYPSANGNWDASMLQTMLAMGVYLDDRSMFDRGAQYYLNGKGNGAVRNYFKPSGQCQETGRDQAHTQMGLGFLACTCEVAWNQGIDLYGAYDSRLLKGYEYTAKYNLGFDVPYEPYRSFEGRYHYKKISDESRGRLQAIYEKVLNHYGNRKGLQPEYTRQIVMKLREGLDDKGSGGRGSQSKRSRRRSSSALATLMFANQPSAPDRDVQLGKDISGKRPNIILLLADDLGYGDLSCFGSPAVRTPHLDKLAAQGMKFNRFYAASAVCSPTRASVLTGRYPLRFGITKHFNDRNQWLPESATTIAELLKGAGYNTAHVGKWHLGGLQVDKQGKRLSNQPGPRQHGFDFYQTQIEQQPIRGRMGRERTLFRKGGSVLMRNDQRIAKDDPYYSKHFTDANGDYAVELIEKLSAEDKPFFINLWWLVPHKPYEPAPEPHWSGTVAKGISEDQCKLSAGDTVFWADGEYSDVTLKLDGVNGKPSQPIKLRATTPGGVVLCGESRFHLGVKWWEIEGFHFSGKAGQFNSYNSIEFRGRNNVGAQHVRLTNCAFTNLVAKDSSSKWIQVFGRRNAIDHCYFSGKNSRGALITVELGYLGEEETAEHRIAWNHFADFSPQEGNDNETIRVGSSEDQNNPATCFVEHNLFTRCDGENEIITNKSSFNTYRANTFCQCNGALVLRHGHHARVEGNFFFGDGSDSAGGIRVTDSHHLIVNNYLQDLTGNKWNAAFSIMGGKKASGQTSNGYQAVDDIVVAHNSIINCTQSIYLNSEKGSRAPTGVMANNLVASSTGPLISGELSIEKMKWIGNLFHGAKIGSEVEAIESDPGLKEIEGLLIPDPSGPVANAAIEFEFAVNQDINGQQRSKAGTDIGADEVTGASGKIVSRPLKPYDVGVSYSISVEPLLSKENSEAR